MTPEKEKLVIDNLKLVGSIARRYQNQGLDFDNLYQEGSIGLMTAAEKFDPERGYKFSTYATYWIRQSITRALDNSHLIRKPVYINEKIKKMAQATRDLVQENGYEPTSPELAKEMNLKESEVRHLLKIAQPVIGTENIIVEDKTDLINEIDSTLLKDKIEKEVKKLNLREQKIFEMRFKEEKTFDEIGEEIGISSQRVCELIKKTLKKLRNPDLKAYI